MPTATIAGFAAFGTEIQIDSAPPAGPAVWVTIEGVGDITGPNSAMGEAEITAHSTGIPVRQFLPTLADPGELSFPCFWDPSDPTQSSTSPYGLESMFWAKTQASFRQVLTDSKPTAYQFTGFVKQLSEVYPLAGIAARTTIIRIIGQRTIVTFPLAAMRPVSAYVSAKGGTRAAVIQTGADKTWKMEADQDWLHVAKENFTGGGGVSIAIAPNTSGQFRRGHILIPALELSYLVQQAA